VDVVLHGIDTDGFAFRETPDDYVMFLGRFTDGKGPIQAIEIAKRAGVKIVLAAPEDDYYRTRIAPLVDGERVVYAGEVGHDRKVALLGGARALLYPVQAGEPFGLVLAEAMACGTPVAALDRGAVREVIDDGLTGVVFENEEAMAAGLSRVFALDRRMVRERGVARYGAMRMVDEYIAVYERLVEAHRRGRRATAAEMTR
jgi:glycosyltransferase involved in cell wall biosynthesis